ncbi:helix-turn-helix domain-containing protein [Streptomyces flaveolus]|uniref:helix-turn-helix domain-containing protein n=1 Tax=Streptomyces flaveolus TaxID=67297 RepID=UPI0036FDDD3D
MRYPQGGGLTAERQAFRERVRMEAAAMFAEGRDSTDVAKEFQVSVRSVRRWRQVWKAAGQDGVRSRGPASKPELSDALFAVLEEELSKGPVAHGRPDQRRAPARINTLIGRRLIYRPRQHADHKSGDRKSFAWTECRDLLIAAHQRLDAPVVLIWDNVHVHKDRRMRAFIDAQAWLTVCHPPSYATPPSPLSL